MIGSIVLSDWTAVGLVVLGVPSCISAWNSVFDRRSRKVRRRQDQERSDRQHEVSDMVGAALKALTGTDNPAELADPGPANPSIRDSLTQALEETAALTSEVALLHRAFELHLAAPHGGDVPEWLMRAVSSQQKEVLRRAIGRL